jgi:Xaa-Pro aminopeptidase
MFQSFDSHGGGPASRERVDALRELLSRVGLAGFIVPHADEHLSEYLPPSAERLAWLTGFTGSAGLAIVLRDKGAIFVDGRYTLQVRNETDGTLFAPEHLIETPPPKWLARNVGRGDRIGYDPRLMTVVETRRFADALKEAGAELVPVNENPIDTVWTDRPAPPLGAVYFQPLSYSGEDSLSKIARIKAALAERHAAAAVLSAADSIAWTFNIRGSDIRHNPVPLSFAVLRLDGQPQLYIDGRKLSNAVRDELADLCAIAEPSALAADLAGLATDGAVLLDPQATPEWIARTIREAGGAVVEGADPVALLKARKNPVELDGARRASRRDGAAVARFLAWLDEVAGSGEIDEIAAAEKLEAFRADMARRDGMELVDLSFDTISGSGPHGAIIHYRVTRETSRRLQPGELYLVDSGGQYRDGTTDITRTVAIGAPTPEMRDRATRVLKGHIALATARFPAGTSGAQIDPLARLALWAAGLDYDHGTGHGVGSFLSVHEGPARISKLGHVGLEPGMILSNEPGYYKAGHYGIRLENLVVVTPPELVPGGERAMLGFETLTLCPFDRRLVDPTLMTAQEVAWLDAYHAEVNRSLSPLLDERERAWLAAATRPIAEG